MLIVKKFHDYYDSAMGSYGIDKTCVYDRTPFFPSDKYEYQEETGLFLTKKIGFTAGPYSYENRSRYTDKNNTLESITPFVIGFCGKTYVGYCFKYNTPGMYESSYKITYSIEDFLAEYDLKEKEKTSHKYYNPQDYKRLVDFYTLYDNKEHSELFIKHKTPIFVYDFATNLQDTNVDISYKYNSSRYFSSWKESKQYLMYNPCLKSYEFYKIFNAAHAFQEIQMYIQGVLGSNEKEIIKISDKDKIAQHGFDKWSFRKEPKK